MSRKQNSLIGWTAFIALFLVVLIGVGLTSDDGTQAFTVVNEEVWTQDHWTAECVSEGFITPSIAGHTDAPTWYHCNSEESGTYIPENSPDIDIDCTYTVSKVSGFNEFIYCADGEEERDGDCVDVTPDLTFSSTGSFKVPAGSSVYINTARLLPLGSDAELSAEYPSFIAKIEQADNLRYNLPTCDLRNQEVNGKDVHGTESTSLLLVPNEPINIVTEFSRAKSAQVVSLEDVEGGDLIYITRPGYYNLIKETSDGELYSDTTEEFQDDNIECTPRTTGCSDEAKITSLESQSCDEFGGAIVGYAPVENDPTRLCKYECSSDDTLSRTNDCVEVPSDCPDERPLWSADLGCYAVVVSDTTTVEDNIEPLFIALIAVLVIGLMYVISIRGKK